MEPADIRALDGIRVVDFSRILAGPYATMVLADHGADVIKIESVPDGDPSRVSGTAYVNGESGLFLMWNRGKRSIALDLRHPDSKPILTTLIDGADVLVENFRPGVADDMGIGYEAVSERNPRLVYCSLSAFGPVGPLASQPGTDSLIQAMSGLMALTGEQGGAPVLAGIPVADMIGALLCVQGILLALTARQSTGRGQKVDVSLLEGMIAALNTPLASYWATGRDPERAGASHPAVAPYQVFETVDGHAMLGAWTNAQWPPLCRVIGREDLIEDSRYATNQLRVQNRVALNRIFEPIIATRTTDQWAEAFAEEGAMFAPVLPISKILQHPQLDALGSLQTVDHPRAGRIPQIAPPVHLSETPGAVTTASPLLGEHSVEILREVGFSQGEIARLGEAGVFSTPGGGDQ
ncbi:MAG: CoA transferase [Actinomycetota bacterium]|nr:CoA transferase [Actinomycetota bacterium]